MSRKLLPGTWKKWFSAIDYFIKEQGFPIRDEKTLQGYLAIGSIIMLQNNGHQFTIDLLETSRNNFEIVALGKMKGSYGDLEHGEVIIELPGFPFDPKAYETYGLKLWMKPFAVLEIDKNTQLPPWCRSEVCPLDETTERRLKPETKRDNIVQVAKHRKLENSKKKESPKPAAPINNKDQGHHSRHREDNEALMRSQKEIVQLKKALRTKDEEIKKTKQMKTQLEAENERHIITNHRLQSANVDLQENVDIFRLQANDAAEWVQRLTSQLSNAEREADLASKRVQNVENVEKKLKNAYKQLKDSKDALRCTDDFFRRQIMNKDKEIRKLQEQLSKLKEQPQDTQQNPPQLGNLDDEIEHLEKQLLEDRFAEEIDQIEQEIQYEDLKSDLKTTKAALKEKTDELASATKKHAEELRKAEGSKEKCRCKDKKSYLESVEEHVEKLRGTMEDVLSKDRGAYSAGTDEHGENMRGTMEKALKHVSIYQGRKRRRTEGPDFEY